MRVLLVLVLVAGVHTAFSQPTGYREATIRASVSVDPLWCKPVSGGYDRPFEFRASDKVQCDGEVAPLNPDFARQRVIFWSVGGDCHVKAVVKVFQSDAERRIRVITNALYGGCRASGHLAGAIVIDKPPAGYRVSVEDVSVDEDKQNGFALPPPPPMVVINEVRSVKQLDFNDCLPLTGESRWMISTEEHLSRNLEGKQNEKECGEKIASNGIDLGTRTLIGVSFQSGFCGVPEGLKLSVQTEVSSDRRNYVVVKARYNDPKPTCDKWTTHPVWLVVPKVDAGFILEVDAKPLSRDHEPRVAPQKPIEWIEK